MRDSRTADLTRVELCREALATALQGEAIACRDRFSTSSDLRDIALAILNRQASLDATVPETIEFAERQVDFALDLRARHTIDSSDKSALDRAIEMVTAAQTFLLSRGSIPTNAAPGSRQRSAAFRATEALADLLGERFEDRSDALDLDRAIEVATVAHNLASGDRQATAAQTTVWHSCSVSGTITGAITPTLILRSRTLKRPFREQTRPTLSTR